MILPVQLDNLCTIVGERFIAPAKPSPWGEGASKGGGCGECPTFSPPRPGGHPLPLGEGFCRGGKFIPPFRKIWPRWTDFSAMHILSARAESILPLQATQRQWCPGRSLHSVNPALSAKGRPYTHRAAEHWFWGRDSCTGSAGHRSDRSPWGGGGAAPYYRRSR